MSSEKVCERQPGKRAAGRSSNHSELEALLHPSRPSLPLSPTQLLKLHNNNKMEAIAHQLYGNATELVSQFIASTKPLSYDLYANTNVAQLNALEVSTISRRQQTQLKLGCCPGQSLAGGCSFG